MSGWAQVRLVVNLRLGEEANALTAEAVEEALAWHIVQRLDVDVEIDVDGRLEITKVVTDGAAVYPEQPPPAPGEPEPVLLHGAEQFADEHRGDCYRRPNGNVVYRVTGRTPEPNWGGVMVQRSSDWHEVAVEVKVLRAMVSADWPAA